MLKKIFRDFLILFGLSVLWASTSRMAMKFISGHRVVDKWWGIYPRSHGNLVSRTYLDFVKVLNSGLDRKVIKRAEYTGPRNVVLYIDGDSHTWDLEDTMFAGICGYHYIDRYGSGYFNLDKAKKNVLIIEYTERSVRECFGDLRIMGQVKDSSKVGKAAIRLAKEATKTRYASFTPEIKLDEIFNKNINQNLQFNLFNYQAIIPMFEFKAAINYYCFKRASGGVVISKDGNYLFLKETTDGNDINSSYADVSPKEVAQIVNNCNILYDNFIACGYKEVYLSIIPNAASIVQADGYNRLIPRIQNDPNLRMKIIDAYSMLNSAPQAYYYHGDSHWNMLGKQKWMDMVNDKLASIDNGTLN